MGEVGKRTVAADQRGSLERRKLARPRVASRFAGEQRLAARLGSVHGELAQHTGVRALAAVDRDRRTDVVARARSRSRTPHFLPPDHHVDADAFPVLRATVIAYSSSIAPGVMFVEFAPCSSIANAGPWPRCHTPV